MIDSPYNRGVDFHRLCTSNRSENPPYEVHYRSKAEDAPQENQGIYQDIKDTIQESMKIWQEVSCGTDTVKVVQLVPCCKSI